MGVPGNQPILGQDSGQSVPGLRDFLFCQVSQGAWVSGLGSRVSGLRFRVLGSGFRVQGLGFKFQGSGFKDFYGWSSPTAQGLGSLGLGWGVGLRLRRLYDGFVTPFQGTDRGLY